MSLALRKVEALEAELAQLPQAEIPTRHFFIDGLYGREMFVRAGTVLTGARHKTSHIVVISLGKIVVTTDEGVETLEAPCIFVAKPGIKRAGYALKDTVWTTFHATTETELDKIEAELVEDADKLIGKPGNIQALENRKVLT